MPTYSYRCTACGNEFDVRQSFSDAPLTVCEKCGGALRKLFNSVGIVFKGSGFYHNDAKSSSQGLHSSERSGGEEGRASGESSSEAPASGDDGAGRCTSSQGASSPAASGSGPAPASGSAPKAAPSPAPVAP